MITIFDFQSLKTPNYVINEKVILKMVNNCKINIFASITDYNIFLGKDI